ncbi:MAG: type I DNA topoisomerase [Candidatus Omnitrophica bacterium]|nr:type I DNA topoisomerase [Candidatus Omnitrophota bacterium]
MDKKNLVIVESPTKARTIGKILGDRFVVIPSMGHVIDLPEKQLGVDIKNNFEPCYEVIPARKEILLRLKKESKNKDKIYVATDPDREGEAIGWHLKERLFKDKEVLRVIFHEITPSVILEAFKNPRDFDLNMVQAQIGRRILDRIVGYYLSPLLWKKIARGLSAGRVQSVALKLIVDRERQIKDFVPQEYWEIEAELKKLNSSSTEEKVLARLERIRDEKIQIKNKTEAEALIQDIKDKQFIVKGIKQTEKKRYPSAPFTTSTLQQEAFNRLRFNATKTMIIAQQLYEGIDIGQDSPVGLITYMRTDSVRVADEAIRQVREFILSNYGKDYLPEKPNVYKVKKLAQQAHEAIRPTLISRSPETLKEYLSQDQYKLYELIYNRFLASQMNPARYLVTTAEIQAEEYLFVATATKLLFDGFMVVYEDKEEQDSLILPLEEGEVLELIRLIPSQHFTKPPPRFSDSSLVKALEEEGIGRPSTYAPIISTLLLRNYVRRIKGYFYPTELGIKVSDLLGEYFPKIMDVNFTALMEDELDEIEEGRIERNKVLKDFYLPFKESLDFALKNIKKQVVVTEEICERCGRPMVIKWGRKGKFLSCSGFPKCKNSRSITTGIKCPEPGCGGELVERRSRKGFFFGCSNFPKCKFTTKTLPEAKTN